MRFYVYQIAMALAAMALADAAVAQVSSGSTQRQQGNTSQTTYTSQSTASQQSPFLAEYSAQASSSSDATSASASAGTRGQNAGQNTYRVAQGSSVAVQSDPASQGPSPFADMYASGVQQQPSTPPNSYNGACNNYVPGIDTYCTTWTLRFDELILQRTATRSQVLYRDATTTDPILNSQDLNFPMRAGFQMAGTRRIDDWWDLDVQYFQLDGWRLNTFVGGDSQMITDSTGAFFLVTDGTVRYTSAVYLGEVNLRRHFDWLTLFGGFRMGELNEHYRGTGLDGATTAFLTSNTFNHLYGFQLGADIDILSQDTPWRINAVMKAGVYGNHITRDTQRWDDTIDDSIAISGSHAAFIGELNIGVSYQFSRHVAARLSYQAMWLDGVALAPEQIGATDFTGVSVINDSGHLFCNGVGLGFDVRF